MVVHRCFVILFQDAHQNLLAVHGQSLSCESAFKDTGQLKEVLGQSKQRGRSAGFARFEEHIKTEPVVEHDQVYDPYHLHIDQGAAFACLSNPLQLVEDLGLNQVASALLQLVLSFVLRRKVGLQ